MVEGLPDWAGVGGEEGVLGVDEGAGGCGEGRLLEFGGLGGLLLGVFLWIMEVQGGWRGCQRRCLWHWHECWWCQGR